MDTNFTILPQQFNTKKTTIDGVEYHVPILLNINSETITTAQKQSFIMKTMTVDGKEYYVPFSWYDNEYTRNMVRNSVK